MSENNLWGKTFAMQPGDIGKLRHSFELVPLDVQVSAAQRAGMGVDEDGYQAMLRRCREANPGCGEPLLVRAEDGAAVNGVVSLCWPRTLEDEALARAGIDVGPSSAIEAYRDRCEERDLELLASNGDYYPYLTRVTPIRDALDDLVELAQENLEALWRDDLLTSEEHEAALRQLKRERNRVASLAPEGATLESLARDARHWEEHGQYAAVTITPDDVRDKIFDPSCFPEYAELDVDDFEDIARNACDNFPAGDLVSDLVYDQIIAEADALVGQRAPLAERVAEQGRDPDVELISPENPPLEMSAGLVAETRDESAPEEERGER